MALHLLNYSLFSNAVAKSNGFDHKFPIAWSFAVVRPHVPALVCLVALHMPLSAAPPSAARLPGNTKLHISTPDFVKLQKAWQRTKVSQIFDDPKLKPFLDDLANESTLPKFG